MKNEEYSATLLGSIAGHRGEPQILSNRAPMHARLVLWRSGRACFFYMPLARGSLRGSVPKASAACRQAGGVLQL